MTPHKNGTFRIDIQELSSVETLYNPTIYISMSNLYGTPRFVVLTLWDIRMFAFKQNYTILAKINIQKWKWFMNKHLHLYIIYLLKIEVSNDCNPWIIMHIWCFIQFSYMNSCKENILILKTRDVYTSLLKPEICNMMINANSMKT